MASICWPCLLVSVYVCKGSWPNLLKIPKCTCSISDNSPFRTEMWTFLFRMMYCGIWNKFILRFVRLFHCILCFTYLIFNGLTWNFREILSFMCWGVTNQICFLWIFQLWILDAIHSLKWSCVTSAKFLQWKQDNTPLKIWQLFYNISHALWYPTGMMRWPTLPKVIC